MYEKNVYILSMAETKGNQRKKSAVMKYLKALVMSINGNSYTVKNIKGKVTWTELKKERYFK